MLEVECSTLYGETDGVILWRKECGPESGVILHNVHRMLASGQLEVGMRVLTWRRRGAPKSPINTAAARRTDAHRAARAGDIAHQPTRRKHMRRSAPPKHEDARKAIHNQNVHIRRRASDDGEGVESSRQGRQTPVTAPIIRLGEEGKLRNAGRARNAGCVCPM